METSFSKIRKIAETANKFAGISESAIKFSKVVEAANKTSKTFNLPNQLYKVSSNLCDYIPDCGAVDYKNLQPVPVLKFESKLGEYLEKNSSILSQINTVKRINERIEADKSHYFRIPGLHEMTHAYLDNWEWELKEKNEKIVSSQKVLSEYIDSFTEIKFKSEGSLTLDTTIKEQPDDFDNTFAISSNELLLRLKRLGFIIHSNLESKPQPQLIDNILHDLHIAWDEYEQEKKSTTRLIFFVVASRLKLNKVLSAYRLNRREIFRKINSFFFKNLDDSHDLTLLSTGY